MVRDRNGFYPDVSVFCEEANDGQYREHPCLLVEVVSPSSRQRVYETKAIAYLQIPSLLAYLIVDPARDTVEAHLRYDVSQPWRSVSLPTGASIDLVCPPVTIDVAELFR